MTIFTCNDTFESMMTCIYDAWDSHLGHANIRLEIAHEGNLELFCEYRHISSDVHKAQKVIRSIQNKISWKAYSMIYAASLSPSPEKVDIIYRFLLLGFSYGKHITDQIQHPLVMPLFELQRKVFNEAHYFKEFIRFSDVQNTVLLAKIEPKCHVLTLIAPHFADRMPSENWLIMDAIRQQAIVHPKDCAYYLTPLSSEEIQYIEEAMNLPDPYIDLWKGFFQTIGIKERKNDRCQRNMLPLWYRKNMTEFIR
ncbi:MAG: TIGR03915 family putative DNA repair protein [Lachnospiraceae bacterium]|jgi:probable DNA metabolism protein